MRKIIENENLKVEFNLLGGSLTSIYSKENKEEYLYQIEENSWQGQDVAIFPFVARLKDKTYTYEGNTYFLRNHGLCRYYTFDVIKEAKDEATILFKSSEETLKEYPFNFHFYITYKVINKTLSITYEVINDGEKVMPFGIGAHPAFKLIPEGDNTTGNYVELSEEQELTRICFDEKGEMVIGEENYGKKKDIEVDKELFRKYQTLCVKGQNLNDVVIKRKDGKYLKFHYDNINYLVLWSFPNSGNYVALEPWMSLPDYIDADKDILKKKTLIHLKGKEKYIFHYQIEIN